MEKSLAISLTGTGDNIAAAPSIWVGLEQKYIPEITQIADLTDIQKMLAMARSGQSASEYKRQECPVELKEETTAEVTLDFYVWPYSLSMQYNLSADVGVITPQQHAEVPRSFDVVAELQETIQLPYVFEGSATWETNCYNEFGVLVSPPTVEIIGSEIKLSKKVFGVLRVTGVAKGYTHSVVMTFDSVFVPETDDRDRAAAPAPQDTSGTALRSHNWGFDSSAGNAFDDWQHGSDDWLPGIRRAHSAAQQEDEATVVDAESNDEGYNNITNLTNSVTCTWTDGGKEKNLKLSLDIPKCVLDVLSSCPGDNEWSSSLIAEPANDYNIIYFDACRGTFLCREYVRSRH